MLSVHPDETWSGAKQVGYSVSTPRSGEKMIEHPNRSNRVSRRKVLKAGAAATGGLIVGAGTALADSEAGDGLVREAAHRPGVPFRVTSFNHETEKNFDCGDESTVEPSHCYNITYEDEPLERQMVLEVRPSADNIDLNTTTDEFGEKGCTTITHFGGLMVWKKVAYTPV